MDEMEEIFYGKDKVEPSDYIKQVYSRLYKMRGEAWEPTDVEIDKLNATLTISIDKLSLIDIFNEIILTEEIPFAKYNDYYKVLNTGGVIPQGFSADGVNILYLLTKEDELIEILDINSVYNINLFSTNKRQMEAKIKEIKRLFTHLPSLKITINSDDNKIGGVYYYLNKNFNTFVFAHLAMNDPNFKLFITIDEHDKASKRVDDGASSAWSYFYFNSPATGRISASISQKLVELGDPILKTNNLFKLKLNQPYIRIKVVDAESRKALNKFIKIFSMLLVYYSKQYDDVCDIYKRYKGLEKFGYIKIVKQEDLSYKLGDIEPDIFMNNYSRLCSHNKLAIVNEGEQGAVKFPRDSGNYSKNYESDGLNQRWYKSTDPTYPFVGLIRNTLLPNKDKYPFLPCCYKTDRRKEKNWLEYYNDEIKETEASGNVISTDKKLKRGQLGALNPVLNTLFNSLHTSLTNGKGSYFREGVDDKSENGFLSCLNKALNKSKTRDELLESVNVSLQSAYNTNPEKIIRNGEYVSPGLFTQLLEHVFNINIICFNKSGLSPIRYEEGYYKYAVKDRKTVYVYENNSVCELIIFKNKKGSVRRKFVGKQYEYFFNKLNRYYTLNTPIKYVPYPEMPIVSQFVDKKGKCRRLNVSYRDLTISLSTSPLPPLNVPIDTRIYPLKDEKVILSFLNDFRNTLEKIEDAKIMTSAPKKSKLEEFSEYKKFARYLTEYSLWLFSQFIESKKKNDALPLINDSLIGEFMKQKTVVQDGIVYEQPSKKFSLDSSFIDGGGKVIYNSREFSNRMGFVIKMFSLRNTKGLIEYKDREYIQTLYTEVADFTVYPNQTVLYGADSLEKFSIPKQFILNKTPIVGVDPYFMKRNEKVYLCQNARTREQAEDILRTWEVDGYNKIHSSGGGAGGGGGGGGVGGFVEEENGMFIAFMGV
jgi:phage pi2 protein 07